MSEENPTGPESVPAIGFVYPGHAAEDDFQLLADKLSFPIRVEVVHTEVGEDAHREDALREAGGIPRMREGAALLSTRNVSAVVWASTSTSFVQGWAGAEAQAATLSEALRIPGSTTAIAFSEAIRAIGISKVAIAATYPDPITTLFQKFLAAKKVQVVHKESSGIMTAVECGTVDRERVLEMALESMHPEAEALLIPDTALHTAALLEELERLTAKPVLTANQVTFWEGLRIAGLLRREQGLGTLFQP